MPANLEKARELFLHAVGKLPAEQWNGYVAAACGGDAELEQQVRHYLQVHRNMGISWSLLPLGLLRSMSPSAKAPAR